jgi:DNA-binding XRE family transcriptional regulator
MGVEDIIWAMAQDRTGVRVADTIEVESMSIAEKVRYFRRSNAMLQEELAEAAGLSQATISLFETGANEPSIRSARKLARALGVEPTEFLSQL